MRSFLTFFVFVSFIYVALSDNFSTSTINPEQIHISYGGVCLWLIFLVISCNIFNLMVFETAECLLREALYASPLKIARGNLCTVMIFGALHGRALHLSGIGTAQCVPQHRHTFDMFKSIAEFYSLSLLLMINLS